MAPLTRAAGSVANPPPFASFNPPNEPEIIEIDDDDDDNIDDERASEEDEEMVDDGAEDDTENDSGGEMNGKESPLDLSAAPNGHDGLDLKTPELFTSAGVQQALHPLRRTADRVTRQIEAFAGRLDSFKHSGEFKTEGEHYEAVHHLVKSYQILTQDAINDISKQSTLKRARMGWKASMTNGAATHDPKTEEELQRLQLEVNTWQLLTNLIAIDTPETRAKAKTTQQTAFQTLHRYSSDRQVWQTFVDADPYAMECIVIMKWLEYTAKNSPLDIDSAIDELETQAERGQGLWTNGWLYTKETIKGHKRLRAWPQPLEPHDPGITSSLLSSEKSEPLITQLDPDAVLRQKSGLQKQDQFFERATWMTCWKMIRQGENWTTIREWARNRLEPWRAVSLCGSSVDKKRPGERFPVDDGHTRLMNWRSQDSWRAACSALARNPNNENFERAVYGLLCGETEAAFKVCQSWDDYLYVYFNSIVLSRYQGFCKQLQRKISHSPTSTVPFHPEPAGCADFNKFVQYTKGSDRVGVEARNPFRTIQAAILGRSYDSFFYNLAKAVSALANTGSKTTTFIPNLSPTHVDESLINAAEDGDALRIAAHLLVVAESLGYARSDTQFFDIASVNISGYIANLEAAGMLESIPLYASLLPSHSALSVLGQVLIEVVDPIDREQQVSLMKRNGIDVEAVLAEQWRWVSTADSAVDHPRARKVYPKVIRRKDGCIELVPVKKDYIGTDVSPGDERSIRCLEWLRCVDGQWGRICQLGAQLYRKFYITGRLAAARELSKRMLLTDVSLELFGYDLPSLPVGPVGPEDNIPAPTPPQSPSKSRTLGSHRRNRSSTNGDSFNVHHHNILLQQAQTMRDLEQLILGFDSLENFAIVCEKLEKLKGRRDSGAVRDLSVQLQEALDDVSSHIDAVKDDWLLSGENEDEQAELEAIRHIYIPEIFLDYHSALYYTGNVLSPDILVQCMNVATQVSDNEFLCRSFQVSGRMAELVDALALASKAMVNTRVKPGKKHMGGESLGIWNATEIEEDNDMPEAQ